MNSTFYLKYVLTAITLFIFQSQSSIIGQTFESKIDSLLEAKYQSLDPGAVFLVAKNGNTVYKKAFGIANLELNIPMKTAKGETTSVRFQRALPGISPSDMRITG